MTSLPMDVTACPVAPDVCDATSAAADTAFQAHPLVNRPNLA